MSAGASALDGKRLSVCVHSGILQVLHLGRATRRGCSSRRNASPSTAACAGGAGRSLSQSSLASNPTRLHSPPAVDPSRADRS